MDIISYQKGMKAKKALKTLHKRLGATDEYKEGATDIEGGNLDTDARLDILEENNPGDVLLKRVSAMEANTHINLNKHNLQVESILQAESFRHQNMVFDDLSDMEGIDVAKSVDILHDVAIGKVGIATGKDTAEVVTVVEELTESPTMIALSFTGNNNLKNTVPIDFTSGLFIDTEYKDGKLQIVSIDGGTNYKKSGFYETGLELGENFSSLYKVNNTMVIPTGTSLTISVASSLDGNSFTAYTPINTDGTIATTSGRYVKVKIELTAGGSSKETLVHDFLEVESSDFQENGYLLFDGAAKLKTAYSEPMTVDSEFAESGTLLRKTINKYSFKSIEKIEVIS